MDGDAPSHLESQFIRLIDVIHTCEAAVATARGASSNRAVLSALGRFLGKTGLILHAVADLPEEHMPQKEFSAMVGECAEGPCLSNWKSMQTFRSGSATPSGVSRLAYL